VNTVVPSFNTIMEQMTKVPLWKKKPSYKVLLLFKPRWY